MIQKETKQKKQDHLHTKSVSSPYQDLAFAEWGSLHYHLFYDTNLQKGRFSLF